MDLTPDKEAYKLYHDATLALSQIEENGIRIDVEYLTTTLEKTKQEIEDIKKRLSSDPIFRNHWRKRFGEKANLTSHEQLGEVIFGQLGLKRAQVLKKKSKKSDKESASEAAFADVDLPFVKDWFRMKKLDKAAITYLTGILRETVDGYCHPSFNLNTTVTYRSSSDTPNFQNIPKRNPEIAKLIRRCFVARPGYYLVEVDFSQIEVRGAAVYTHDSNLIRYIKDPSNNMHTDTAMDLFFLKKDQVDKKTTRDCAKNMFVFPEFYGAAWFQQAPEIWASLNRRKFTLPDGTLLVDHLRKKGIKELGECTPEANPPKGTFAHHVKNVERIMWEERFPEYSQWKRDWWNSYQKYGAFKFKTGFVCAGVFKRNEVLSYAIQGTAFHWLLWSMVQIHRWLRKNKMQSCIVGQIHDSMVIDVAEDELDEFLAKAKQVMTSDICDHWEWINVPLEIEADASPLGGSWAELKEVALK